VTGWPLGEELALSDDLTPTPASTSPLESAIALAASARPEISAARESARQEDLLLFAAGAERAPRLVGLADAGLSGNQPDGGARTTGSVGVGLSVPIFTGGL